jgi:hypothetical protein
MSTFVKSSKRMSRIFDYRNIVLIGDCEYGIHIRGSPGKMHRNYEFGFRGNGFGYGLRPE